LQKVPEYIATAWWLRQIFAEQIIRHQFSAIRYQFPTEIFPFVFGYVMLTIWAQVNGEK